MVRLAPIPAGVGGGRRLRGLLAEDVLEGSVDAEYGGRECLQTGTSSSPNKTPHGTDYTLSVRHRKLFKRRNLRTRSGDLFE